MSCTAPGSAGGAQRRAVKGCSDRREPSHTEAVWDGPFMRAAGYPDSPGAQRAGRVTVPQRGWWSEGLAVFEPMVQPDQAAENEAKR